MEPAVFRSMLLMISGCLVRINNTWNLPAGLLKIFEVFRVTESGNCPLFKVEVLRGRPEEKKCTFISQQIQIMSEEKEEIFCFRTDPKCSLVRSRESRNLKLYIFQEYDQEDIVLSEQIQLLLRLNFEYSAAFYSRVSLHASVFVHNGNCICATGASGAGKSTLTRNWMAVIKDSFVLNGDRPVIHCLEDEVEAYGAPWCGKEQVFETARAPVLAIVEVCRHCKNRMIKLDALKAYTLLLQRVSKVSWDESATNEIMKTLEAIVERVPVYRYYCRNDESAGKFLYHALYEDDGEKSIMEGKKDLRIKEEYVIRKILGEYIAVPVGSTQDGKQTAVVLNEVGAFIWEQLKTPTVYEVVLDRILSEYDVDRNSAEQDLKEFLEMARMKGMLDEE